MNVLESAAVSSTVGRVLAKDLDEGINAEMKYSFVDGDGIDAFDITTDPNSQVGIITVRKVRSLYPSACYHWNLYYYFEYCSPALCKMHKIKTAKYKNLHPIYLNRGFTKCESWPTGGLQVQAQ